MNVPVDPSRRDGGAVHGHDDELRVGAANVHTDRQRDGHERASATSSSRSLTIDRGRTGHGGEIAPIVGRCGNDQLGADHRCLVEGTVGHGVRRIGIGEPEGRAGRRGMRARATELAAFDPAHPVQDPAWRVVDPEVPAESGRVMQGGYRDATRGGRPRWAAAVGREATVGRSHVGRAASLDGSTSMSHSDAWTSVGPSVPASRSATSASGNSLTIRVMPSALARPTNGLGRVDGRGSQARTQGLRTRHWTAAPPLARLPAVGLPEAPTPGRVGGMRLRPRLRGHVSRHP